jgi:cellobiose phosphorylase
MSRAGPAMEALDKRLIDREHALVQLLAPPFDKGSLNPGYIRGYVPGVRENGASTRTVRFGPPWRLRN